MPEEFRFKGDKVFIKKMGPAVVLIPKENAWQLLIDSLDLFSKDYMESREQPKLESREELFE